MRIEDVLHRRTDLSTFLVHLTRDSGDQPARERLRSILEQRAVRAISPMGHAVKALERAGRDATSQRCVSFTETPLEHVSLLLEVIEGRSVQFQPYGIGITKRLGRKAGVNPVWYVDITPGHTWISTHINALVDDALQAGDFDSSPLASVVPFIEQMGSQQGGYRKEFWWEREWRHKGDWLLPSRVLVLCPEADIECYADIASLSPYHGVFIDPRWGLERIIATLAGFAADDTELV